jgi:hypothetical protein
MFVKVFIYCEIYFYAEIGKAFSNWKIISVKIEPSIGYAFANRPQKAVGVECYMSQLSIYKYSVYLKQIEEQHCIRILFFIDLKALLICYFNLVAHQYQSFVSSTKVAIDSL